MKIAVCISTRNRPEFFFDCLSHWAYWIADDFEIFTVDDASDEDYADATYRFEQRVGIPCVKNKCIELAYDWGADYFFLSDDDCYPIAPFADAYINSGIEHLSYCFTNAYDDAPERAKPIIKDGFTINKTTNGCMLFFTRKCFDTVGGFDTRFGLGMYEHNELTRRIYNAGLTPYPNMDIVGSDKLFYSLDQHNEIERSFSKKERIELTKQSQALWNATRRSKQFIDFREKIEI